MRKYLHLIVLCIIFLLTSAACSEPEAPEYSTTEQSAPTETASAFDTSAEAETKSETSAFEVTSAETTVFEETVFTVTTAFEQTTVLEDTTAFENTTVFEYTTEEETTTAELETVVYQLSEDTADPETGAFEYRIESIHAGTDIYYIGNGENADRIIVIDAGHQLHAMSDTEPNAPSSSEMKTKVTAGTTGQFTGNFEYKLNLSVALCLRDELYSRGYSVVMIRETDDVEISNAERALVANKYNAAAYLRIHANGSDNPEISGALTVCQTPKNPDNSHIYYESRLLSINVLNSFCSATGIKDNKIWETDTMTGTNWSQVPTTIIEMGYMSNQGDDEYMATDGFLLSAAQGIADGIDGFIQATDSYGIAFTRCDVQAVASGNVYVRSVPSTESDDTKVGLLKIGDTVRVIGCSDSWCRIVFNNQICYVSNKYLVLE